ncbi:MAG: hypothetical protein R6W70_02830 [bacterium]
MKLLSGLFESFLNHEAREKSIVFSVIFFLLIFPVQLKIFFIFVLACSLLPSDITHRRIKVMIKLPFTRKHLFFFSYLTGIFIIFVSETISHGLFSLTMFNFPKLAMFFTACFSVSVISAVLQDDNKFFPLIVLIIDFIAGSSVLFPGNNYASLSPVYQKNPVISSTFILIVFLSAFFLFVWTRREQW